MNDWNWYQQWAQSELNRLGFSLESPSRLASAIMELSTAYQTRTLTPWEKPETTAAYLSYFMPLNLIRAQAVLQIVQAQALPLKTPLSILDFGSGAGTTEIGLAQHTGWIGDIHFVERSETAVALHRSLHQHLRRHFEAFSLTPSWHKEIPKRHFDLGIFQTSLNELDKPPQIIWNCESLILIEASTSEKSRPLLKLREELILGGYFMWAPCTHQKPCPLLHESKKDWCHDRIQTQLPPWFPELSKHLPIDNSEVTFSYLVASRTPPPPAGTLARVVGDPLWEKGKVRQMISRGEHREFLSWLRREGDPALPQRGDLLDASDWPEPRGAEIRIKTPLKFIWRRK